MDWEMWTAAGALATLITTVILAQGRWIAKCNEAALEGLRRDMDRRFEGLKAVLNLRETKNSDAERDAKDRMNGLSQQLTTLNVVARDVAFLAGRLEEWEGGRPAAQGAARDRGPKTGGCA